MTRFPVNLGRNKIRGIRFYILRWSGLGRDLKFTTRLRKLDNSTDDEINNAAQFHHYFK